MLNNLKQISPLTQLRLFIDGFEIQDAKTALCICRLIPNRCPFERRISFWGRLQIQIPSLCKLNPLYRQLTQLRLRSLTYLENEQGKTALPQGLGGSGSSLYLSEPTVAFLCNDLGSNAT